MLRPAGAKRYAMARPVLRNPGLQLTNRSSATEVKREWWVLSGDCSAVVGEQGGP